MNDSEKGASPKSPRYYYKHPVRALSAMLDHGIRIVGHTPENIVDWMSAFKHEQWGGYRWYVHPDSLHLLGPEPKDLIECE
jgi:hypothetical protein